MHEEWQKLRQKKKEVFSGCGSLDLKATLRVVAVVSAGAGIFTSADIAIIKEVLEEREGEDRPTDHPPTSSPEE